MGVFRLFKLPLKDSEVGKLTHFLGEGQLSPQPEPAVLQLETTDCDRNARDRWPIYIYIYIYAHMYVYVPALTFVQLCKRFCDSQMNADVLRAKYYYGCLVAAKQLSILSALLASVERKWFKCLLEMQKLITFYFIEFLGKKISGYFNSF